MKKVGCGLMLIIALFNGIIGGLSVNYILSWFHKDIPMVFDMLIGLLVGEFSVPVALVGKILKLFGVF